MITHTYLRSKMTFLHHIITTTCQKSHKKFFSKWQNPCKSECPLCSQPVVLIFVHSCPHWPFWIWFHGCDEHWQGLKKTQKVKSSSDSRCFSHLLENKDSFNQPALLSVVTFTYIFKGILCRKCQLLVWNTTFKHGPSSAPPETCCLHMHCELQL